MILYSPVHTPRLQYISRFIGKELIGEPLQLTDNAEAFSLSSAPKINYSNKRLTNEEYWIAPHTLLSEQDIKPQRIDVFTAGSYKAFFESKEGDHPFDIFSAVFYLLSRYEEYLPHKKDTYGRYAYENSLAFKEGFLQEPLVNKWIEDFKIRLKEKFPSFQPVAGTFRFLPTYDIDEAYSYKHKDWDRVAGAVAKAFVKGNWSRIAERRLVVRGRIKDPFDSYSWMDEIHEKHQLKPRYFFLLPEKTGKYDRNILPGEQALQSLIKEHASKYDIGIHPSWQTGDDATLFQKEISTLQHISNKKIQASRQHFIRFNLPQTFRHLVDAGIIEDFSMGYGSINGFRASVASPFYWYDLQKEEETSLVLYPFCFMEANSFFEQKFSSQQALEEMRHYYTEVKAVGGMLIMIWHNTFLGTDPLYKGWKEAYESFIKEVSL